MAYIIVGSIIFTICTICIVIETNKHNKNDKVQYAIASKEIIASMVAAFLASIVVSAVFCGIARTVICTSVEYHDLPAEVYQLKEQPNNHNQYYKMSTSGHAVSVYIVNHDGTYTHETYAENDVVFVNGNTAEITIYKKERNYSEMLEKWFWFNGGQTYVDSVTIMVPSNNEANARIERCPKCNCPLETAGKYCSRCGVKTQGF